MIRIPLVLLAAAMLSGCAIPIPPTGPDAGKLGYIGITYTPNVFAAVEKPLPQPTSTTK